MMRETHADALLVQDAELATLLAGCGITGILLPSFLSGAVHDPQDVASSLVNMYRDGLLKQGEDELLHYANVLRSFLEIASQAVTTLVWRLPGEVFSTYLLMAPEGERTALLETDSLRTNYLRISCMNVEQACALLYERLGARSHPLSQQQLGTTVIAETVGELYRRGDATPFASVTYEWQDDVAILSVDCQKNILSQSNGNVGLVNLLKGIGANGDL